MAQAVIFGTSSPNYNVNRHYRFSFYNIEGEGPFTIVPLPTVFFQDYVNFSFDYAVTNNVRNTANFRFYNLPDEVISAFTSQTNNRGFKFDAWYNNDTQGDITFFNGSASIVNHYREGPDVITDVMATDLFTNLYISSNFEETFIAGTTFLIMIQTILAKYGVGLSLNQGSTQFLSGSYKTAKTFIGSRNDAIKQIAFDSGNLWYILQNVLMMYPLFFGVNNAAVVQSVNKNNGLVGYPRAVSLSVSLVPPNIFSGTDLNQNLSLISVTTLLRNFKINDLVNLQSEFYNGVYIVLSVAHNGEWRGNSWYSNLTLIKAPG